MKRVGVALEAFIQQVQQLVADGVLTEAEAAPLIAGAHRLLAALQDGAYERTATSWS